MNRLLVLGFLLFFSIWSQAQNFQVNIGDQTAPARLIFVPEDKRPLVFLAVMLKDAPSFQKAILNVDGEEYKVVFKRSGSSAILLLPSASGELILEDESGDSSTLPVSTAATKGYFKIDKSCQMEELRIGYNSKVQTTGFGGLYCMKQNLDKRVRLYFSTSADTEWLGGSLFEIEGKGMRFKTFELPLDGSKPQSIFRWGDVENPAAAVVQVKALKPKDEEPPPYFFIGTEVLQQSLKTDQASTSWMSVAARLDVLYPISKKLRARGGAGYLVHSLADSNESDPKYFQARLSADYVFANEFFVTGGYDLLSFSSANPDLVVDFEAPLVGLGKRFQLGARALDVLAYYSQPVSGSGSTRMGAELALKPFFFLSNSKGLITFETLELNDPLSIKSDRISFQYLWGF